MAITIKYFGAIEEATGTSEEELSVKDYGSNLNSLKTYCLKKYPTISGLTFKIAVNQTIEENTELKDGDEVAFLPPFAGG